LREREKRLDGDADDAVPYPREADDRARSTIGLFEELGEIAEAIRVFEKYPMYFLGEAADIFSYLMGIVILHPLFCSSATVHFVGHPSIKDGTWQQPLDGA